MRAIVIVEGIDCSGKTSFCQELARRISASPEFGHPITRSSFCTIHTGWLKRELLTSGAGYSDVVKSAVFTMDRLHRIRSDMDNYHDFDVLIMGRWIASTLAYNGGNPDVFKPNECISHLPVLQVYLQINDDEFIDRLSKKGYKDEHEKDLPYLLKVKHAYPMALSKALTGLPKAISLTVSNNTPSDFEVAVENTLNALRTIIEKKPRED